MWSAIIASSRKRFTDIIQPLIDAFKLRVATVYGLFYFESCLFNQLTSLNTKNLLVDAKLYISPNTQGFERVYVIKPNLSANDMVVSRASRAYTTLGSAVDSVPYNLWNLQCNDFTTWSNVNGVVLSSTTDTTDPRGGLNATRYSPGTSTYRIQTSISGGARGWYNLSLYAKADTGTVIRYGPTNDIFVAIDLITGSIISVHPTIFNVLVENKGNGWWRISLDYFFTSNPSSISAAIRILTDSGFIYGSQITSGQGIKEFINTTDGFNSWGRITTEDETDGCASILLETTSTNRLQRSDNFENLYWEKTNLTVTQAPVTELSPEGTATEIITATSNSAVIGRQSPNIGADTRIRIFSVYLKRKTGTGQFRIKIANKETLTTLTNNWVRYFVEGENLDASCSSVGTTHTVTTTIPHGLVNGDSVRWTRLTGNCVNNTSVASVTVTSPTVFTFVTAGSVTGTGTGIVSPNCPKIIIDTSGDEAYIFGGQLEGALELYKTAKPTSYIRTIAGQVIRQTDNATMDIRTGILSGGIFSVYCKMKRCGGSSVATNQFFSIRDTNVFAADNWVGLNSLSNGDLSINVRVNGSGTGYTPVTQPNDTDYFSFICVFDGTDVNIYINGNLEVNTAFSSSFTSLISYFYSNPILATLNIKELAVFDRVLTPTEITSLN
jgi:hypothetical protein